MFSSFRIASLPNWESAKCAGRSQLSYCLLSSECLEAYLASQFILLIISGLVHANITSTVNEKLADF